MINSSNQWCALAQKVNCFFRYIDTLKKLKENSELHYITTNCSSAPLVYLKPRSRVFSTILKLNLIVSSSQLHLLLNYVEVIFQRL